MKESWDVVAQATALSLGAIIASKPDDTEKRLRIIQTVRLQLLNFLEKEFGEKVKQGGKQHTNFVIGFASVMYRVLAAEIWKLKEPQ